MHRLKFIIDTFVSCTKKKYSQLVFLSDFPPYLIKIIRAWYRNSLFICLAQQQIQSNPDNCTLFVSFMCYYCMYLYLDKCIKYQCRIKFYLSGFDCIRQTLNASVERIISPRREPVSYFALYCYAHCPIAKRIRVLLCSIGKGKISSFRYTTRRDVVISSRFNQ